MFSDVLRMSNVPLSRQHTLPADIELCFVICDLILPLCIPTSSSSFSLPYPARCSITQLSSIFPSIFCSLISVFLVFCTSLRLQSVWPRVVSAAHLPLISLDSKAMPSLKLPTSRRLNSRGSSSPHRLVIVDCWFFHIIARHCSLFLVYNNLRLISVLLHFKKACSKCIVVAWQPTKLTTKKMP